MRQGDRGEDAGGRALDAGRLRAHDCDQARAQVPVATRTGGDGQARDRGFKEAKGKILASLDSDCEAKNGWLETITKELKKYDAITGPIKN